MSLFSQVLCLILQSRWWRTFRRWFRVVYSNLLFLLEAAFIFALDVVAHPLFWAKQVDVPFSSCSLPSRWARHNGEDRVEKKNEQLN